jgi:hypothetical protein
MLHFNINLTSLAVILWSGMLIITGSIWVLASQVRRLAEIMEDRSLPSASSSEPIRRIAPPRPRAVRRREVSPGRLARIPAGRA